MVAIEHCQSSNVAGVIATTITITDLPINNNELTTSVPSDILSPLTPTSPASTSTTISSTSSIKTTSASTTSSSSSSSSSASLSTATSVKNVQPKLITSTSLKMSSKPSVTSTLPPHSDDDNKNDDKNTNDGNNVDNEIAVKSIAINKNNNNNKIHDQSMVKITTQELSKKILKLDLKAQQSQDVDDNNLTSPKSPITARLSHQTSLASSVDVEDRKTLREALYQGIFSRHRRTIFAFGSFLRMLRSRTSQYNTIRSSSEGEDVDEVNNSR